MLRLQTFGSLGLQGPLGEDRLAEVGQPKRLALLVYLAAADQRGFHRRDTLVALLWPDLDEGRARAALRKALHYLRSSLGADVVLARGDEEVRVERAALWCDAREFGELAARGDHAAALDLYAGPFLPGLHISAAPEFERWVDHERQRHQSTSRDCALALARTAQRTGAVADAVARARRAVEIAPLEEITNRQLIERLAESGDIPAAIAAFERYTARLAQELEVDPGDEICRFVDRMKHRTAVDRPGPRPRTDAPAFAPDERPPVHAQSPMSSPVSEARTRRRTRAAVVGVAVTMLGWITFTIVRAKASDTGAPAPARRQITFSGKALRATISPDGQFIAYTEHGDTTALLIVQDLAGAALDTIASWPGKILTLEWSPDGTRLLVGTEGEALVIPRLGGAQRRLRVAALTGGLFAYWLPDGRVSVHGGGSKSVHVLDLAGGDTLIVPVPGAYWGLIEIAWSRNARSFVAVTESTNPTRTALRAIGVDGATTIIVEDSVLLGSPRWSRDGDTLFYLRDYLRNAEIWHVAVSPSVGLPKGPPRRAHAQLEALPVEDGFVHFSATRDARRMVYARGTRFSNIVVVERGASGGAPRVRALTTGTTRRWSPVPSPDGRWIAFAAGTYESAELYRVPITGGPATQITFGARVWPDGQIAWSPDSREIAFASVRAGRARVWIAGVDDGRLRSLDSTRLHLYTGHLTWSPGARIAYLTDERRRVDLADPRSGEVVALIPDSWPGWFFSPRYSPNGNQLAVYWHPRREDQGVWVFDLRSSAKTLVAPRGWPRGWSQDGRYVYAGGAFAVGAALERLSARGPAPPERVLELPFRSAECTNGVVNGQELFVCATFDFVSDIWMIDNANAASR